MAASDPARRPGRIFEQRVFFLRADNAKRRAGTAPERARPISAMSHRVASKNPAEKPLNVDRGERKAARARFSIGFVGFLVPDDPTRSNVGTPLRRS